MKARRRAEADHPQELGGRRPGQGLPLGGAEVPGDQHMVKKMEERLDLVLINPTVLQGA